MSVLLVFISLSLLAVCQADVPVASPIRCGELPRAIFTCLSSPQVVPLRIVVQCDSLSECEQNTCMLRKSGLMDGDKVDRLKIIEYFDNFAKGNPDWQAAVDAAKTNCLQADIPAQGIHLNCPAYDAVWCSSAAFFRNASPAQWETSKECEFPRQYVATCPICPSECFGAQIPVGSCNACQVLPRSP